MRQLFKHPQATFVFRASGDSMRDASILDESVVLVGKATKPAHGQIVLAAIDRDFPCKRLHLWASRMKLRSQYLN